MTRVLCELQYANGRVEGCPEDDVCAFWIDDECVLEPVYEHLERNRELAAALLEVRGAVAATRPEPKLRPTGWAGAT